jgi:predicted DNA-binding transcriptional regulator AlpA
MSAATPDLDPARPEQLLTCAMVRKYVPVTEMTLFRWVRDKKFPAPVKLTDSPRARNFWRAGDILAYLARKAAKRVA